MKNGKLTELPRTGTLLVFQDEIVDNVTINDVKFQACQFRRLGMKDARVEGATLAQCCFEDCYLRKAHFVSTQLTGSMFRKCNLEKATFQCCDLRYCTFEATRLDRNEVIGCLPVEPNLRRQLAQNLRKNFETLGDKDSADAFLDIEIRAHEEELLGAFRQRTEYYRSHYNSLDQAMAGLKYLGWKINGIVWGHGHRVARLIRSYVCLTLMFGLVVYCGRLNYNVVAESSIRALGFWESLYQAFAATVRAAGIPFLPASPVSLALQVFEGLLGTLFLALLAASIYRRIAR